MATDDRQNKKCNVLPITGRVFRTPLRDGFDTQPAIRIQLNPLK